MIVSIHQPSYLPWLGYIDRIRRSDLFIFLDTVQFQKQSFQNRTKIRTINEWTWLTVPMLTKGRLYNTKLNEMLINNQQNWQRKHLESIKTNYIKAEHYDEVFKLIQPFYEKEYLYLSSLCFEMLEVILNYLNINTKIIRASDLEGCDSKKSDLILELCEKVNADVYLSGPFGKKYLNEESFSNSKIKIEYHNYNIIKYRQVYEGFEKNMSVLDLLMNEKSESKYEILSGVMI